MWRTNPAEVTSFRTSLFLCIGWNNCFKRTPSAREGFNKGRPLLSDIFHRECCHSPLMHDTAVLPSPHSHLMHLPPWHRSVAILLWYHYRRDTAVLPFSSDALTSMTPSVAIVTECWQLRIPPVLQSWLATVHQDHLSRWNRLQQASASKLISNWVLSKICFTLPLSLAELLCDHFMHSTVARLNPSLHGPLCDRVSSYLDPPPTTEVIYSVELIKGWLRVSQAMRRCGGEGCTWEWPMEGWCCGGGVAERVAPESDPWRGDGAAAVLAE